MNLLEDRGSSRGVSLEEPLSPWRDPLAILGSPVRGDLHVLVASSFPSDLVTQCAFVPRLPGVGGNI